MLEDLKILPEYDGFLFLAESALNPPMLRSHRHEELEVNLVVRGQITYVAEGRSYCFSQRSLLWFFSSQEHHLVDRSSDAQYYVAVFKPDLIQRACRGALYADLKKTEIGGGVLNTMLEPESFDLVKKTMDSIMNKSLPTEILNREGGYGYGTDFVYRHGDPDGLNAGLRHLLLLCWRCREHGRAIGSQLNIHPAVHKALQLLETDPSGEATTELGKRCGVSEAYLSRLFAKQVGVPLSRYRNTLRLQRFWAVVRRPERPKITDAVFEAGFGSYAQFYKVFVEAYGKGPRDCLEQPG